MAQHWQVVKQEQVQAKDTTGTYVPAVRVWFKVGADGPFYVDVPQAGFTAEAAAKLINDYTSHIVNVSGLASRP